MIDRELRRYGPMLDKSRRDEITMRIVRDALAATEKALQAAIDEDGAGPVIAAIRFRP